MSGGAPDKKLLFLCGDYMEDYEVMVPFQALKSYGIECDTGQFYQSTSSLVNCLCLQSVREGRQETPAGQPSMTSREIRLTRRKGLEMKVLVNS